MLQHQTAADSSRAHAAHIVQLFDSNESLAHAVADFFAEGLIRSETMLAVMAAERWYSVAMHLSASGFPIDEVLRFGRLTVRSADDTLKTFMRRDWPDQRLFDASVGELVPGVVASGRPLRIYCEMVNVLAARGEYAAAHQIEEFWNELGTRTEFRLFCGYSAAHFGDPRTADVLRRICACHTDVLSSAQDVLGSFLVRAGVQPA